MLEVQQNGRSRKVVKMVPEFAFPIGLDDQMR